LRRKGLLFIVVVGIVSIGLYVLAGRSQRTGSQNQVQYRQEAVALGDLRSTISGTGPVTSVNGVMVRSHQSGTITQIDIQDGDLVQAGDLLIRVKNENLEAQLKQAQVDLASSLANLDSLLNPLPAKVRSQELKVEQARLAVRQRLSDRNGLQVTAPLSGVISSVKVALGSSVTTNASLLTIFDDFNPSFLAAVPQSDAAKIQMGQAATVEIAGFGLLTGIVQQNVSAASPISGGRDSHVPIELALPGTPGIRAGMVGQARLIVEGLDYPVFTYGSIQNNAVDVRSSSSGIVESVTWRAGDRVNQGDLLITLANEQVGLSYDQAVADLAIAEHNLAILVDPNLDPNSQVQALRSKIEAAQITVSMRQSELADLQIKAPVDGEVSSLSARVGDKVTTNQQLLRVADYGVMQVTIMVDELDVARTKVGQAAVIALDALPGRPFRGTVSKINPEGFVRNDIATFEVTVTVAQPEGLMAGMNATVTITVEDRVGLYVPAQAVTVRQGVATVLVLVDNTPVEQEIKIGLRAGQRVEVLDGLVQGDKVITTIVRPPQQPNLNIPFLGGLRSQQSPTPVPTPARP